MDEVTKIYPFEDEGKYDAVIGIRGGRISLPYAGHLGYISVGDMEKIIKSLITAVEEAKKENCYD